MAQPGIKKASSILFKLSFNREKTFRPKVSFWPQGKANRFALVGQMSDTGVMGSDLRLAVVCPPDHDLNEWLAVNMVDFFNQINLIYGNVSEFCTKATCPVMNAGPKYDYLWADGVTIKKPMKCCAPEYVSYLMAWVQTQLDDQELFPRSDDVQFPPRFFEEIRKIFKRLFRVYAHVYYSHFKNIESMGADAVIYLNTCYKHFMLFVFRYSLIDRKELEPLSAVTNQLLNADEQVSVLNAKPTSPTASEAESETATTRSVRNSVAIQTRAAILGVSPNTRMLNGALRKALVVVSVLYVPEGDELAKQAATELSVQTVTSDLDTILARPEIDWIFICLPPTQRNDAFHKCLAAGKHIVIESPTARDENEAYEQLSAVMKRQQMMSSTDKSNIPVVAILDQPYRFLATVHRMRALIQSGYVGEITHVNAQISSSALLHDKGYGWWCEKDMLGGVLSTDGAQLIDLISHVTLKHFSRVSATLTTSIGKRKAFTDEMHTVTADDIAQIAFELDDGVVGNLTVSHVFAGPPVHLIEVRGSKGYLALNQNTLVGCQLPSTDVVTLLSNEIDDQENKMFASPWAAGMLNLCRAARLLLTDRDDKVLREGASIKNGVYVQAVVDAMRRSAAASSAWEGVPPRGLSLVDRSVSREDLEESA